MRHLLLTAVMGLGLLAACGQAGNGKAIAPAAFEKAITPKAQLIDVRTPAEFAEGHLKDARNLDWTSGALQAEAAKLDKSAPVLLYCASGRRSAAAREFLSQQGFKDVQDMDGGIRAWTASGKPVVR